MTETTITTVRFPHISSPGALLRAPLPEALTATLPAKLRREHEKLAGRADEAAREIARLRAELDGATARDRTAASKAALEGGAARAVGAEAARADGGGDARPRRTRLRAADVRRPAARCRCRERR